jgi:NAD(P)-dependent dehydrogenase (short-subunit alcohol dehydrogenase family)
LRVRAENVTKEADVKAMVDKAVGVFGRLDIAFMPKRVFASM